MSKPVGLQAGSNSNAAADNIQHTGRAYDKHLQQTFSATSPACSYNDFRSSQYARTHTSILTTLTQKEREMERTRLETRKKSTRWLG